MARSPAGTQHSPAAQSDTVPSLRIVRGAGQAPAILADLVVDMSELIGLVDPNLSSEQAEMVREIRQLIARFRSSLP